MEGSFVLGIAVAITVLVAVYLIGSLVRSIQDERRSSRVRKIWKNFGLSIALCTLFLTTWFAHGLAQWQTYTDEQREHGQPTEVGDFTSEFLQATLENWQSEFLQLFSFVVLASLLIHKGSAESKDSDEEMQQALKRIEEKLGTSP